MGAKKCIYCDKTIKKEEEYCSVKHKKTIKYVHLECKKQCIKQLIEQYSDEFIYGIYKNRKKKLEEEKKKEKEQVEKEIKERELTDKDNFFFYIIQTYNISNTETIPKYIYKKVSEIVSGKFKGFNDSISYEDLLIMFQKQQKNLTKIYMNNVKKGKKMTNIERFNYDLAVIVNKYDSYKQWKEKQKLLRNNEQEEQEYLSNRKDFKALQENNNNLLDGSDNEKELDIDDIVDDLLY